MSARLYVTDDNELRDWDQNAANRWHWSLRIPAHVISFVFHPLFVPVYIIGFLLMVPPYFLGFAPREKWIALVRFFVIYSFFPLVTVLLIKGLGFVDSIYLRSRRERIIPYIACGIFYFWMWYVLRNQPQFARELVQLALGIFLASSLGLIANIYMKVSMHAISMGILICFMSFITFHNSAPILPWLLASLLIAGLVCTARLIVSDHQSREIYIGLGVGMLCQYVAFHADFLTS